MGSRKNVGEHLAGAIGDDRAVSRTQFTVARMAERKPALPDLAGREFLVVRRVMVANQAALMIAPPTE